MLKRSLTLYEFTTNFFCQNLLKKAITPRTIGVSIDTNIKMLKLESNTLISSWSSKFQDNTDVNPWFVELSHTRQPFYLPHVFVCMNIILKRMICAILCVVNRLAVHLSVLFVVRVVFNSLQLADLLFLGLWIICMSFFCSVIVRSELRQHLEWKLAISIFLGTESQERILFISQAEIFTFVGL